MATPINAPMAGEIWHLSIEDLFQPVQEAPRLGGDGPFVINLSVSTAPINVPTKPFTSSRLEAHVYQIQVTEDGRTRYRLRLGPFATEDEADAILTDVRDTYPGALTATAGASDLRVIGSMQAKADKRHPPQKPNDNVVIDKAVSAKIAANPSAPEKAMPEKKMPKKAASAAQEPAKAEAEISIDIAWPTPALAVPPSQPMHAAAAPVHAAPAPVHAAPAPQWELPELDVPLPSVQKRPVVSAPVRSEAVTAAPKAASKDAAPLTLVDAPVLTEVVVRAKAPAPKGAAKRAAFAAPVLTEVVPPKAKTTAASTVAAGTKKAAPVPTPEAPVVPAPVVAPAVTATPAAAPAFVPAPVVAPAVTATPAATPVFVPAPVVAPAVAAAPAAAPAFVPAPAVARAAPAPTSSPSPAAPPASMSPPPPTSRPALMSLPVRTALSALIAQASQTQTTQTAPVAPATPPAAATAPRPPTAPTPKPVAAKSAAPIPAAKPPAPVVPQSVARKSAAARFRAFASKATANKLTSLQHVVVATAPVPAPREVKKLEEPLESLESTQTLRVLTPTELEDHATARWFVIELACADHAFDPDAVPNLDIFSEYRLYSVAGLDQGRTMHALRLGFFREEIGAVAVASYLAAYWDKPTIKRVSVAERERFADQRVEARKDVGATGKHAVIEITDELVARRRRSSKMPAATKPSHRPI